MRSTEIVPAAVTGPSLFCDPMHQAMHWADERLAMAYCLDAPELIVAGGTKAVVIGGVLEAITARTLARN